MSPVSGATATKDATRPKAPARRKRGEGQWALGYREPLNKNEENKKFDDGLNVRQRIIDVYSKRGFDSIDPADLRGRFRWYGLYTQRRPGIDGGKTAILEPEELDDRYFMLRVRIDGGQLSGAQLRTIADISNKYARGTADVTDRQNIQLHWIEIESVPAIWEALEAVGLDHHRGLRRHAARHPRLSARRPGRRRADRRDAGDRRRSTTRSSATRRSPTCRASSRPRSAAAPRSARTTRSTTSRSRPCSTRRPARPATTCGSAAGCPPTR